MPRTQAFNGLIVLVVVVGVAGVAWFRSQPRERASADPESMAPVPVPRLPAPPPSQDALSAQEQATPSPATTSEPADVGRSQPLDEASTQPVAINELPPPPTTKSDDKPATGAETPASMPAAARKLPRVVDLGAGKCKACIQLAPILEQLKKEYAGRVDVEFIDVWKDPKAGDPYKIRMIPTQIFYTADGKEIWRHEGFLPKAEFIAKFKELGVK